MGGLADPLRFRLIEIDGSGARFRAIGLEDLIADRTGQASSVRGGDPVMLMQARLLYETAKQLDETYLDARIRTESVGTYTAADLRPG